MDFYRLSDYAPDPVVVEKFLSNVEDLAAPVLRTVDQERRPPTKDELEVLIDFMAFQWVRVPRYRPFILGVLDRLVREHYAEDSNAIISASLDGSVMQ